MAKKLFVGGLAWATTSEGLRQAFEQFGQVTEANVVKERDSGRSRGFGFVQYANDADADKAISQMDGKELDGRMIHVNEAQPKAGGARR